MVRYYPKNIEKVEENQTFTLNTNHTHFILYDDGSKNEIGREILFRANLEYESSKGKTLKEYQSHKKKTSEAIPLVLLVIRGSLNTLKMVHLYRRKVPVVLLVVIF